MQVVSPAFENHQPIPNKYTCQGEDVSPQLNLSQIPPNTKTLAIIVEDPDAPGGTFDHWIAWNIAPPANVIEEGVSFPHQGRNTYNQKRYRGPCPPPGQPHRYYFKVYALDKILDLPDGAKKNELEKAMQGHILDHAELIGTYQRS